MKKFALFWALLLVLSTCGCTSTRSDAPILATTRPVYDLTSALCAQTGLDVSLLIGESVSCLHDYTLSTAQMKKVENAQLVVISGAGLEDFQADLLAHGNAICDASAHVPLLECEHEHDHDGHDHEHDAHIWLSPANAKSMAQTICDGLSAQFPAHGGQFAENLDALLARLDALQAYGEQQLENLSCRELITFHDGFSYLADAFNLTILAAVEEESGSEASARELIELTELVRQHALPAVFHEVNGSVSACDVISHETGVGVYALDMCMGDGNYFDCMYYNIDTLKEALE